MSFEQKWVDYEFAPHPPDIIGRTQYRRRATEGLTALLDQRLAESEYHAYLERYPCLVPGVNLASHGPVHRSLFTKPHLPGLTSREPDFMWLVTNSVTVTAVLVEIERPGKPIFNKDGSLTAKFTQALGQLTDWRDWSSQSQNVELFRRMYRLDNQPTSARNLAFKYCMVYGTRSEFEGRQDLVDRRAAAKRSRRDDEEWMTWDRLVPQENGEHCLTVRVDRRTQVFNCRYVPDRVKLGPLEAMDFVKVSGKVEALESNKDLTEERRRFLAGRFSYWDKWAEGRERGFASVPPHHE